MDEKELCRVEADLEVMRQAVGARPLFFREHIWLHMATALAGLLLAAVTAFSSVAMRPGNGNVNWAYVSLIVASGFAGLVSMSTIGLFRKTESPLFWRETLWTLLAACVAVPLYLVFATLLMRSGFSLGTFAMTSVFLAGLYLLLNALPNRGQWHRLGWAAAFLLLGFLLPFGTYETAGIFAGGCLVLGGLSTAWLMASTFRGEAHAAH